MWLFCKILPDFAYCHQLCGWCTKDSTWDRICGFFSHLFGQFFLFVCNVNSAVWLLYITIQSMPSRTWLVCISFSIADVRHLLPGIVSAASDMYFLSFAWNYDLRSQSNCLDVLGFQRPEKKKLRTAFLLSSVWCFHGDGEQPNRTICREWALEFRKPYSWP